MDAPHGALSPEQALAALVVHAVDFVIIGGLAAIAHGSRRMTRDIDIVVEPSNENLHRLEQALAELSAVKLVAGGGEQAIEPADVAMVALGTTLHTRSAATRLDVVGAPAGAARYPELLKRSIVAWVGGVEVRVVGLDDLIAMKRAAGRPLDLQDIADLTAPDS
jgi:hypothetical protein